jgi:DnaK suppressor protein
MTTPGREAGSLVDEFRERLQEARRRLCLTVARTDEELRTLEAHQPGAASEDAPQEVVARLLDRLGGDERHQLDEIDAAQARLAAGTYGVCEACWAAIPLARLRAMPATRRCAPCQAQVEGEGGGRR